MNALSQNVNLMSQSGFTASQLHVRDQYKAGWRMQKNNPTDRETRRSYVLPYSAVIQLVDESAEHKERK